MENVLERIERERFSSLYDPGIYGILTRLNNLGFVRTGFASCSGHPEIKNGKTYAEEGYVFLAYNPYNPKSKELHNKLKDVSIEHNGHHVSFSRRAAESTKDYKIEKYDDLMKTGFDCTDAVGTDLRIRVNSDKENQDAEEIATALSKFWQKVSDLIADYEQPPIREILEPYYFGIRSNYGKIEATHPVFEKYYTYIPDGNIRGKKKSDIDLDEIVKSPAKKEQKGIGTGTALAASALLYLVGAVSGFGAGAWYFS